MDFFKKNRYKLLNIVKVFVLFVFMFGVGLSNVRAVSYEHGDTRLYYDNSGHYTRYLKKVDKKPAYCTKLSKNAAPKGYSGYKKASNWNYTEKAYICAQIISKGNPGGGNPSKSEYKKISFALNCYYNYYRTKGKYTYYYCKHFGAKDLVEDAVKEVNKYKFVNNKTEQSLPKITFDGLSSSDKTLSPMSSDNPNLYRYISGGFKLKLTDSYGGDKINYTYKISGEGGDAFLCTSKTISDKVCKNTVIENNKTYYVYFRKKCSSGDCDGGSVKLTITGKNSSKYKTSIRWVANNGKYQPLTTEGDKDVTINRSVNNSVTFRYKFKKYDDVPEYQVALEKVDENGEQLSGAGLSLYIASKPSGVADTDYDKYKHEQEICTIDGSKTECYADNLTNKKKDPDTQKVVDDPNSKYKSGNYLCYSETSTPAGYKSIGTFCEPISFKDTAVEYYRYDSGADENDVGSYTEIKADEYNSYSTSKKVCVKKTSKPEVGGPLGEIDVETDIKPLVAKIKGAAGEISDGTIEQDQYTLEITDGVCSVEPQETVKTKSICVYSNNNDTYSYDETDNYCPETKPSLLRVDPSKGDYSISVVNSLNNVKISKRDVTGKYGLLNANLEIYTTNEKGECTDVVATAKDYNFGIREELESPKQEDDSGDEKDSDVSDEAVDGDESIDGEDDETSSEGDQSTDSESDTDDAEFAESLYFGAPTKDKDGNYLLQWSSDLQQFEIRGIKAGTYCLVEKDPPGGYIKSNKVTKFSVTNDSKVELVKGSEGDAEIDTDGAIILKNNKNKMSISKQDMATSKEVPGAEMSICETDKNGDIAVSNVGECSVVQLYDGSEATWTSGTEPHEVEGLPAGTYYLVEKVAPDGYDTAESILFKMTEDGVVTDKDGNSLADNKLVMHDKTLEQTKTGDVIFGVGLVLLIGVIGIGVYYYKNKMNAGLVTNSKSNANVNKIKSRKIHK